MSKKYSWLRFVPLYGGIIVIFLSLIKGEINNSILWRFLINIGLKRIALPFFAVVFFFALTKSLFPSIFISVGIFASIIILGFFANKRIFEELDKILEESKQSKYKSSISK